MENKISSQEVSRSSDNTKVYEIVDASSDENYFTLAIFPTLKEAIDSVAFDDEPPCDHECDESVIVEIRERQFGWKPHCTGKVVYKIVWNSTYDEVLDRYKWIVVKPISTTPPTYNATNTPSIQGSSDKAEG
jgi:hypothetical protein